MSSVALRKLAVPCLILAACGGSAPRAQAPGTAKTRPFEPRVERMMISPDRIASVAAGEADPHGAVAKTIVLGRADENRRLFFHFAVSLPDHGTLKSATLLLTRSPDIDTNGGAIELHAARIVDPWDARSLSWPLQPSIEEVREPHAVVTAASAKIVRIDVADIVKAWPGHDPADQGIAVLADASTPSGASFAYISSEDRPPELEIVWAYPDSPAPAETPAKEKSRQNRPDGVKK